jgi:large subunit ribosomal protein L31
LTAANPHFPARKHSKTESNAVFDSVSMMISRRIGALGELQRRFYSAINSQLSRSTTMKDGIHPDYHEITVVMTDGTSYKTRSTYGKAGDTLRLEIDSKSHPAWTGGQQRLIDSGGQLARFNKRFQGFGLKK